MSTSDPSHVHFQFYCNVIEHSISIPYQTIHMNYFLLRLGADLKSPTGVPKPNDGVNSIFTARKRSLEQGNIFTSVCQEFCSCGGVGIPACIAGSIPACLAAGLQEGGIPACE